MGSPIADFLAVAMIAVSLFCAGRLLLALAWRRTTDRDVDVVHVVMGISMAGMLTGWLTGAWNEAWIAAFAASTAWFGWRVLRQSGRRGPATAAAPAGHQAAPAGHLPHLVASAAMLYMLVVASWIPTGAMTSLGAGHAMADGHAMGVTASTGSPVLAVVVAVLVVVDAAVAAGRGLLAAPARTSAPAGARPAGASGTGTVQMPATTAAAWGPAGLRPTRGRGAPLAPRATALCLVAMSLTMAYMLVSVRA